MHLHSIPDVAPGTDGETPWSIFSEQIGDLLVSFQRAATPFPVPPPAEQAAIVKFLDHADRKIRRYIRAKQKLIALLEEQKQAVIHRAVTRGLDPDVPLKPSGVPWLGDIPAHWDVKKLRECVQVLGGMTPSMSEPSFWGGDIPWVTPKDMKRPTIDGAIMSVADIAVQRTSLRMVPAGAVLMVVRGMILARRVPIATTAVSVTINQDMKALVPSSALNADYLSLQLQTAAGAFVPMIDEAGHGTRRLPTERWRNLPVLVPPVREQQAIARQLQLQVAHADESQRTTTKQVALLHELRTRLIADVVTGKVDVREAAAALPEEQEEPDIPEDADLSMADEEAAETDLSAED